MSLKVAYLLAFKCLPGTPAYTESCSGLESYRLLNAKVAVAGERRGRRPQPVAPSSTLLPHRRQMPVPESYRLLNAKVAVAGERRGRRPQPVAPSSTLLPHRRQMSVPASYRLLNAKAAAAGERRGRPPKTGCTLPDAQAHIECQAANPTKITAKLRQPQVSPVGSRLSILKYPLNFQLSVFLQLNFTKKILMKINMLTLPNSRVQNTLH